MEKSRSIIKSSIIVLFAIIFAKLVALGEDAVVASAIGTSSNADSYYMSADILQLFWYFGTLGIVRVYLPEYKSQLTLYGKEQAEKYSTNMRTLFSLFALFITGIIVFLAVPLVNLVAYGFAIEAKEACVKYVRLRAPQIIFWCWTSLATAKLQSQNKFLPSKIPEIVVHIPVIVFSLLMFSKIGFDSLFYGLILGSILGLIVQLPFLRGDVSIRFSLCLKERGVIESLKRIPAAFVSAALVQIHSIVDKIMASSQPTGAVSVLSYGHKMYSAVNGLVSGAISTVAYPKITEYVATDNREGLGSFIRSVLVILLAVMVPFAMAFAIFSLDLTQVLFMRGAFSLDSARDVASVFSMYVVGLAFAGVNTIFQLVFFANGNTKTPMYSSLFGIVCNIILNYFFVRLWGVKGIAIASSIATIVTCGCLLIRLRKYVSIFDGTFLREMIVITVSSVISCFLAFFATNTYFACASSIIRLLIGSLIGIMVYGLLIYFFDRNIYKMIKHL